MKKELAMKIVIFVVVLFIPLIYSFFYLKSYWDPYGDLSSIDIAVVNLDEGEEKENQGEEFLNSLIEDGTFNICKVTEEEALEGMKSNKYYASITIPKDFTKTLNSASTNQKQKAIITYSPNQANNYLATQIIGSAVKSMEIKLQAKVASKIVENLGEKLEEVPNSLDSIIDGASEILEGAQSLDSGISSISDGASTLNSSYNEFNAGLNSAYEGSKNLESGASKIDGAITSLNDGATTLDSAITEINLGVNKLNTEGEEGINKLSSGILEISLGAETLNEGVNTYVTGTESFVSYTNQYIAGVTEYTAGVDSYIDTINSILSNVTLDSSTKTKLMAAGSKLKETSVALNKNGSDITTNSASLTGENAAKLKAGALGLKSGTAEFATKASSLSQITNGIQSVVTALSEVQVGTNNLKSGVSQLKGGSSQIAQGSSDLSTGLYSLTSASTSVKNGINALSEGASAAKDGSSRLVEGVSTFKEEVIKGKEETVDALFSLDGLDTFTEDPVEFKTEAYGDVSSYGVAFTPLFLCIGLWVGALMCYVVLYYDKHSRFGIFDSTSQNKFKQNAMYILLGAANGVITATFLKVGLGFEIQNMFLYIFSSILIGITFMSIIQFLIRNFGDIGKFLALIILVLQLAASGGTFPVETINKFFQTFTNVLPMTYAINLLREILVPTMTNFKGEYIVILLSITVILTAITYVVDVLKNKKKLAK